MARKRVEEGSKGTPEWMATYSDLVTLLFCFFVLLYAMSKPDVSKLVAVAQSMGRNASIIDWSPGDSLMENVSNGIMDMPPITEEGKKEEDRKDTESDSEPKSTPLVLGDDFPTYFADTNVNLNDYLVEATEYSKKFSLGDMLFDSGSDVIKPEAVNILTAIADEIVNNYVDWDVYIEGHTDDVPIKTARFPDNWALSSGRAESVGRFFINECAIEPGRITAIGFGEHRPVDTNETPEGRGRNRRVEIRIVKNVNEVEVIS